MHHLATPRPEPTQFLCRQPGQVLNQTHTHTLLPNRGSKTTHWLVSLTSCPVCQQTKQTRKQHSAGSGAHTDTGAISSRIIPRTGCGTAMMTSSCSGSAHNTTTNVETLQTTRCTDLLRIATAVRLNQVHDRALALIAQVQGSVRVTPKAQAVAACAYDHNCKPAGHTLLSIRQSPQPAAHGWRLALLLKL